MLTAFIGGKWDSCSTKMVVKAQQCQGYDRRRVQEYIFAIVMLVSKVIHTSTLNTLQGLLCQGAWTAL